MTEGTPETELDETKQPWTPPGVFTIASSILASISLFSLVQRAFDLGMGQIVSDMVSFYRNVAAALLGWLPPLINLPFANVFLDLWALSFVGGGLMLRVYREGDIELYKNPETSRLMAALFFASMFLVIGISFIGILLLVISIWTLPQYGARLLNPARLSEESRRRNDPFERPLIKQSALMAVFLILIFAMNAYAPSY